MATFEEAACAFDLPPGQVEGETVDCGYLIVPEDRSDPEGRTIRLAVAIFHPPGGATEPDPILYLSGGPGGSALELLSFAFDKFESLLSAKRDLILFDQRGIGLSEPALDCPDMVDLIRDLLDSEIDGQHLTDEEATDLILDALAGCRADLSAVADLAAYHTAENAADVAGLREALGLEEVNLWAISYGTRLALDVMRDYGEGVRSVVLDSVYPPDKDLYLGAPANADRAFDVLFDGCAADPACNAAFPDLGTVVFDAVVRLNETPAEIEITDPFTADTYPALLTGDDLLGILFQLLYETDIVPSLPKLIYDASQGNYELITLVYGLLLVQHEVVSHGMHYSVQCHDELPFSSLEDLEAELAEHPRLTTLFEDAAVGKLGFEICEIWDVGQASAVENESVASDIPALVLAGQYDPVTPPAWGRHAAETLENSFFFEFPGMGHAVGLAHDCPREMLLAFIDDPDAAPDGACIAGLDLPDFVVPGEGAAEIVMEPYTNETFGISGVAPAGWQQASPGVFSRGTSGLDVASLIVQASPVPAETLLGLLVGQLGLEEAPEVAGEREANGITWTLYVLEVQGFSIDMALADADGLTLIVLLQTEASERDVLYDAVFLPAVDALVPAE
jgi:pimeloyl-ACP methyl ester carboxylesterase